MTLTIDVGNSNICIGGHEAGRVRFVARIATQHGHEADQYAIELAGIFGLYGVKGQAIEAIAIASVVPAITPLLVRALAHFTAVRPLLLTMADTHGVRVDIDNPAELGADILASAIAVVRSLPLPAVVVDMGTATKLTAIDAHGTLRGVAIAPGLFLSLGALVDRASLLGGIALEAPQNPIGRNTAESMKSGVVLGAADMLDGMLNRFEAQIGPLATVVATGGAAATVIPHCKRSIRISDTLLLEGLYAVLQD